ncbi:epimerase [Stenotrophomonas tumulicola]|uniref:Epimerase n=1 Tax=Stenotrophomonas tumulicola TaxID=1685415 RepID=A0A7W3FN00_9GAMM|nr:epimerase [Stenotrophomonas tumulicola]MBA8682182.1 epimerase [Stenotrophomonas tumulicola]
MLAPGELPRRVLVLGMGYSGRVIASRLQAHGVEASGTVRDPASAASDGLPRHALAAGRALEPDLLSAVAQADAVLCSVPPDADGDPALRRLWPALRASPALRWIGYLSSTGVYAGRDGGWIYEQSLADGVGIAATQRRLAESQWRALATERGAASAIFRLPGLYGRGRNALVQLAEGRARHVVRPGLVFSRLHVEDLAAVVMAAMMRREHEALYLPTDDEAAPPQDVLAHAARLSGRPLPPARAWDDPALSPALRRFYQGSKRIDSRDTRERLQWKPRFSSYREGLQDAWENGDGRPPR